jgi:hypothetical protein
MAKKYTLSIFTMPALIIAGMAISLVYANTPECQDSWKFMLQRKLAEGHGNGNGNDNIGNFNGNGNSGNFNGNGNTGNFHGNGKTEDFIGSFRDWDWRDAGIPVLPFNPQRKIPGCK